MPDYVIIYLAVGFALSLFVYFSLIWDGSYVLPLKDCLLMTIFITILWLPLIVWGILGDLKRSFRND